MSKPKQIMIILLIMFIVCIKVAQSQTDPQKCPQGCAKCYSFYNIYWQVNCTECFNENQWQYSVGAYSHIGKCSRRPITLNQVILLIVSIFVLLIISIIGFTIYLIRSNKEQNRQSLVKVSQITSDEAERKQKQLDKQKINKQQLILTMNNLCSIFYIVQLQDSQQITNIKKYDRQKKKSQINALQMAENQQQSQSENMNTKLVDKEDSTDNQQQYEIQPYIEESLQYTWSGYVSYREGNYWKTSHVTETHQKKRIVFEGETKTVTLSQLTQFSQMKKQYFKEPAEVQQKYYSYFGHFQFKPQFWTSSKGAIWHYCHLFIKVSNKKWRKPVLVNTILEIKFNERRYKFIPIVKNVQCKGFKFRVQESVVKKPQLNQNPTQLQKLMHSYKKQETMEVYLTDFKFDKQKQYKVITYFEKQYYCRFNLVLKKFPLLQYVQKKILYIGKSSPIQKIKAGEINKQICYIIKNEKKQKGYIKNWLKSNDLKLIVKIRETGFTNWLLSCFVTKKYSIPMLVEDKQQKQQQQMIDSRMKQQ